MTVDAALAYAYAQVGKRYSTAAGRLRPHESGYADCSGLIYGALHYGAGMRDVPTTSWAQARWCRDKGTLVPIKQALERPGYLVFWGDNHGYDGYGPAGHVAFTVGDGLTLLEARGTRWGIGTWPVTGRDPVNAALVPGLTYISTPPPRWEDPEVEPMIVVDPTRSVLPNGWQPHLRTEADHLVLMHGASLAHDEPVPEYGIRVWRLNHPDRGVLVPGERITGAVPDPLSPESRVLVTTTHGNCFRPVWS